MSLFLTVDEAIERLGSDKNILNRLGPRSDAEIEHKRIKNGIRMNGGRTSGAENLTDSEKELAAVSGSLFGITATANAMDLGRNTVKYLSHGIVGGHKGREDKTLLEKVESAKDQVVSEAVDRLLTSVGAIESEEIKELGVKDKVKVAVGLSSVVDKLSNKNNGGGGNGVQINIFAPSLKTETDYTTIDVTPGK